MKPITTPQDQLRDAAQQALKFLEDLGRNHWGNRSALVAVLKDALAASQHVQTESAAGSGAEAGVQALKPWFSGASDSRITEEDGNLRERRPNAQQTASQQAPDSKDIFLWPDDMTGPTWCYRYEYGQMSHMSDDFEVLPFDSTKYQAFLASMETPRESHK